MWEKKIFRLGSYICEEILFFWIEYKSYVSAQNKIGLVQKQLNPIESLKNVTSSTGQFAERTLNWLIKPIFVEIDIDRLFHFDLVLVNMENDKNV